MWTYAIIDEDLARDDPIGEANNFATAGWSTREKATEELVKHLECYLDEDSDLAVKDNLEWTREDEDTESYVAEFMDGIKVNLYKMRLID